MKKRVLALLLALAAVLGLLAGCLPAGPEGAGQGALGTEGTRWGADASAGAPTGEPDADRSAPGSGDAAETTPSGPETPEETAGPAAGEDGEYTAAVDEDGEYTTPEDVADYLHAYGHLPPNFITKREAQALGWPGGDLWKYAPGKSIGGDYFGNYEGLLPKDVRYRECDVNYAGGSRGAERVIYGDDGSVYYTDDHYASFTQLY